MTEIMVSADTSTELLDLLVQSLTLRKVAISVHTPRGIIFRLAPMLPQFVHLETLVLVCPDTILFSRVAAAVPDCRHLRAFEINNFGDLPVGSLGLLNSTSCTRLKIMNGEMNNVDAQMLGRNFGPHLRELEIWHVKMGDNDLALMLKSCGCLHTLNLYHAYRPTAAMAKIVQSLPASLESLQMEPCMPDVLRDLQKYQPTNLHHLTLRRINDSFTILVELLPTMVQTLVLHGDNQHTYSTLFANLKHFPNLTRLSIQNRYITDMRPLLTALPLCQQLETLEITESGLGKIDAIDLVLDILPRCAKLQKLDLSRNGTLKSETWRKLALLLPHCHTLRALLVKDSVISFADINMFGKAVMRSPALREVDIAYKSSHYFDFVLAQRREIYARMFTFIACSRRQFSNGNQPPLELWHIIFCMLLDMMV